MSEAYWLTATDDEWAAEVSRRWREIDADNAPDPEDDDGESELDRVMLEDLRSCQ